MIVRTQEGIEREVGRLRALNLEHAWEVTVKRWKKPRQNPQNAYLWGVCYRAVAEHTGYTVDDIHQYALMACFGTEEYEVFGKRRVRPQRTTTRPRTMTIAEFAAYVEWFRAWAASEVGVNIPDPGGDKPFPTREEE